MGQQSTHERTRTEDRHTYSAFLQLSISTSVTSHASEPAASGRRHMNDYRTMNNRYPPSPPLTTASAPCADDAASDAPFASAICRRACFQAIFSPPLPDHAALRADIIAIFCRHYFRYACMEHFIAAARRLRDAFICPADAAAAPPLARHAAAAATPRARHDATPRRTPRMTLPQSSTYHEARAAARS